MAWRPPSRFGNRGSRSPWSKPSLNGGFIGAGITITGPTLRAFRASGWHRGRIDLIGDAVHATTPLLASGAGMAVEDGVVLAEEIAGATSVREGWRAFEKRRWDRCRTVVENSLLISRLKQEGGHDDVERLMAESVHRLAQPM